MTHPEPVIHGCLTFREEPAALRREKGLSIEGAALLLSMSLIFECMGKPISRFSFFVILPALVAPVGAKLMSSSEKIRSIHLCDSAARRLYYRLLGKASETAHPAKLSLTAKSEDFEHGLVTYEGTWLRFDSPVVTLWIPKGAVVSWTREQTSGAKLLLDTPEGERPIIVDDPTYFGDAGPGTKRLLQWLEVEAPPVKIEWSIASRPQPQPPIFSGDFLLGLIAMSVLTAYLLAQSGSAIPVFAIFAAAWLTAAFRLWHEFDAGRTLVTKMPLPTTSTPTELSTEIRPEHRVQA